MNRNSGPVLVPVGSGDLAVLQRLVRAYYAEVGSAFDERRQCAALARLVGGDALGRGWLVRLDGRVVGYIVLTWSFSLESGGLDGYIDELFLEPEVRGRGIGTRVLALADLEARRLGLLRLYLEVEHGNPAINLYRRAGFVDHRRHLMSKRLGRATP
jgi:ribosomal protein S18 acetylase RimI-like enzyme